MPSYYEYEDYDSIAENSDELYSYDDNEWDYDDAEQDEHREWENYYHNIVSTELCED